jgi:hypothetical protein
MERTLSSFNLPPAKMKYIKEVLNPVLTPIITRMLKEQPQDPRSYLRSILEEDHGVKQRESNIERLTKVRCFSEPSSILSLRVHRMMIYMYLDLVALRQTEVQVSLIPLVHLVLETPYRRRHMVHGIELRTSNRPIIPKQMTKPTGSAIFS